MKKYLEERILQLKNTFNEKTNKLRSLEDSESLEEHEEIEILEKELSGLENSIDELELVLGELDKVISRPKKLSTEGVSITDNIRVLLYPVESHDRRGDAEFIENNGYFKHELENLPSDVRDYTLTDFMDMCNNEEIELDAYWVSYVRILDDIELHNGYINTVIKSCDEAIDGDWDKSNDGFEDMKTLLERCFIK